MTYQVLARKWRPQAFDAVVGQDAVTRTLRNALASGRVAHAYLFTGPRGVGKTTTARLLAKALACTARAEAPEACGKCPSCVDFASGAPVDVLEIDAASNNGVEEIRTLRENVKYSPVRSRVKVYIVDEVHMLSGAAFNAFLKTLEEPPPHVVFVLATTDPKRIPPTVLSRCQRFDFKPISPEALTRQLTEILGQEGVEFEASALPLLIRASEGSLRDALSLLDQAIALSHGAIDEAQVRDMLGLADRTQLIELYDDVLKGKAPEALQRLQAMHQAGADAAIVLQDMLELTHWLTRAKITPEPLSDPATPEAERAWGARVTPELSIPVLARLWQMLLKGLGEVQAAPQPLAAAEMVLIRLMHAANMPDPADLVRRLSEGSGASAAGSTAGPRMNGDGARNAPASAPRLQPQQQIAPQPTQQIAPSSAPRNAPQAALPQPQSFSEVVALFHARREAILAAHLQNDVHLVQFEVGRIDFRPGERAPSNLPNRVAACLAEWTGKRWLVSVSAQAGEKTLKEQAAELARLQREEAARHPLVQAVLAAFPGASIDEVRSLAPEPAADATISSQGDLPNAEEPAEDEIA